MGYEPDYYDLFNEEYLDDEDDYMDVEDYCDYGSFGMPQLGTEDCEFGCSVRKSCRSIFFARKDCVNPLVKTDEQKIMRCPFFHMGKCYIDFSNYTPSKIKQLLIRLKCRLGILPEDPDRRRQYEREKKIDMIQEGHGRTDISCRHGSRWIWWDGIDGKGDWNQVVACSSCNCGTPPRPFKEVEG